MKYHMTRVSGNAKTGPIPVSTTERASCPDTCALKNNGCYADSGPLRLHWGRVPERGCDASEFIQKVRSLPNGQLWRHNQAGDLPHVDGRIDGNFLKRLAIGNKGKKGFTYTHHALTLENLAAIRNANENGFTVNISANNPQQAARLFAASGLPTVTVMGIDSPNVQIVDGVKIVACPAEKSNKVTCASCAICQKSVRSYVVGFRAHGASKKKAQAVVLTSETWHGNMNHATQ